VDLFSKKGTERKDEQDSAARLQLFGSRDEKKLPYAAPPPPYRSQPQQPSQCGYGGYGAESTSTIDRNRDALFSGRANPNSNALPPKEATAVTTAADADGPMTTRNLLAGVATDRVSMARTAS